MSSTDTATLARQWIESHIALFAVLVIAAVLLIVVIVTVVAYCCCCRKKQGRCCSGGGGGGEGGIKSSLSSNLHTDSVDASSAVTASIRGPHVVEVHMEKELETQQASEYQPTVSATGVVVVDSASLEDVRLQQSSKAELSAEFPNLPGLPPGVEVTKEAELRLHNRTLPEVRADVTAAAAASITTTTMSGFGQTEPVELQGSLRLPRTEVVLQTESIEPVFQQQQRSSPKKFAPPPAAIVVASSETAPVIRQKDDTRVSYEHRHGSSIYQSDENEITIVDSDFSDYEDSPEDETRMQAAKLNSSIRVGLDGSEAAAAAESSWETLPNQSLTVELEPPIRAVDRQGEEYIPAPSPSLEEQQMRRMDNLAELDRTLDVFGQEADAEAGLSIGLSVDAGRGQLELDADAELVDEEEIQPLDRSQVAH